MLKYSYWRTVPPTRDWKQEPDFDFQMAEYGGHGVARYVAHTFYWLCGKGNEFSFDRWSSVALVEREPNRSVLRFWT